MVPQVRTFSFASLRMTGMAVLLASCAAPRTRPAASADDVGTAPIRVLLAQNVSVVDVAATGAWFMLDEQRRLMARVGVGETWRFERDGARVRAVRGAVRTGWVEGPITASMTSDGFLTYNSRRYRGEIVVRPMSGGLMVLTRVRIDDYLAGVVPLEIGNRPVSDSAAVQAQAVSARSYAFTHLDPAAARGYDVTSTVTDQVYGGVEVETPLATRAVIAPRGRGRK
jgi:stage II sporulation protein D